MARFLFATWEGGGHVQPLMLVARGLADRGHAVLVLSDACNASDAAGVGVPFRPWRTAPSRPDKSPATDPLRDWEHKSPMEVINGLNEALIATPAAAYARDTLEAIDDFKPDVVVSQELLMGVMMAAESRGLPLALLTANIWPFPTMPGAPPFGGGLPLAADEGVAELYVRIAEATRGAYQSGLPAVNAAREGLGLPPLADMLHQLDVARRILLATSAHFDAVSDPPAPFIHVGPYLADPTWAEPWTAPWTPDRTDPLVLVTFSSMYQGQDGAVRNVIAALGGLPVRGLVTLGPVLDVGDFPAPPNVAVVRSAPHSQILPHCAVVVSHCGHASTLRPLMAGVPILAIPMGRDQDDNAARAVAAGAAVRLPRDATPEAIAAALTSLIQEPGWREAAGRLGAAIRGDVEARSAEAELEALVRS
ncbi:glycosyltransferase [Caulobacter sp. KR2-114]|uniref:glycosyltransferase n=1 Tax=Caulobacter sp. KR2-114 TaxID=3400912 RepID=UPI003C06E724